jgi:hypothetical protein
LNIKPLALAVSITSRKIYRMYSVDISMIYFNLAKGKRGLWVSRVFDRNPKLTLNSQALVNGWD